MTTEEKAKAYDKALEWMRKVYPTLMGAGKEDVEYYFPEVKESEDERIRKALITLNKVPRNAIFEAEGITKEQALAWLEKQKEQKPADLVEEEYIENRNDGTYTCATTNDGFDAYMNGFNTGFEEGKITLICALKGWIKEQTKK